MQLLHVTLTALHKSLADQKANGLGWQRHVLPLHILLLQGSSQYLKSIALQNLFRLHVHYVVRCRR